MTPHESTTLAEIEDAITRVLPWFDSKPELASWVPPTNGWSITEILDHIVLTSHYLLLLIEKGTRKSLAAKAKGTEIYLDPNYQLIPAALAEAGVFQAFVWHRPDHIDPRTNSIPGVTKENFLSQMHRCKDAVKSLEGGWGHHTKTTMTVNEIGKLDVYQYVVFLCRHAQRHCLQMEQNRIGFESQPL